MDATFILFVSSLTLATSLFIILQGDSCRRNRRNHDYYNYNTL